MKNRLLALLLALSMALSLAACGGSGKDNGNEQETAVSDVDGTTDEPQEAPEEESSETQNADGSTTEEDTDAVTPEEPEAETLPASPAEKPAGGNLPADPAQKPSGKPVETQKPAEKPVEKPTEKPAETPPAETVSGVDLSAFYTSVTSGENWPAMMQAEGEVLDSFYPGLSAIKTKQCGVYTAMISAAVGEIALVEVENADDVQKVKDIFQARIDYQVGDDQNPGGAWYPASIEGWKNGSRIVSNGNYIMMVALSDGADDAVAAFNALFA